MDTDFKNYLSEENTENLLKQWYIEVSPWYNVWKDFITQIPNIKLLEKVKNIPCPILFLHGSKDKECNYHDSLKAYEYIPHSQKDIYIYRGAWHCFRWEQEQAINDTLNFFKKYFKI